MFPVLAEHEINVIVQRNQQNLAQAERLSMIRTLDTAAEASSTRPSALSRAWTRLNGASATFFHLVRSGHRPIGTSGQAAARS